MAKSSSDLKPRQESNCDEVFRHDRPHPRSEPENRSLPNDPFSVRGRVVIVTGAAQGIGRAIALTLSVRGATVVMVDRERDLLREVAAQAHGCGLDIESHFGELGDRNVVESIIDQTLSTMGRIDAVVNNAGGSAHTPLDFFEVTSDHLDRVVDWNLRSTFNMSQAAARRMGSGGAIVNISAISGRAGSELLPVQYSSVKAGVIGLTRGLARHLGPLGIRVNCVAPGFVVSGPRTEALWQARDTAATLEMIPLRRRGTPQEICDAVQFLISDASTYVTGATLDVNGGFFCV